MERVFCIGLNKTGTTSLHQAFKILGYNSVHAKTDAGISIKQKIEENFYEGKDIIDGLKDYNAFLDWDRDETSHLIFKEFYKQYPNSKFIINTRELNSWLDSREKHVLRNQKKKKEKENPEKNIHWLKINRDDWEEHYKEHHRSVYEFFDDKKDELLTYDVTQNQGWKPLCDFLGCSVPKTDFPKANVSPSWARRLFRKYRSVLLKKIK